MINSLKQIVIDRKNKFSKIDSNQKKIKRMERKWKMLSHLKIVHIRYFVESFGISVQFGEPGVNGGPDRCSKVGRAEGQVTQPAMPREWYFFADFGGPSNEPRVHGCQISAFLHRYQTQVILLVAPDEESFRVVVKYTSAWKLRRKNAVK